MLILTEKPGVARDFANTLGCYFSKSDKCFKDKTGSIFITNCVGHLFQLEDPVSYNPDFKNWRNLPVIPDVFRYRVVPDLKDTAKTVTGLLKKHKDDEILIATDADREGEIIAGECLKAAGISDFSKIKRFWVSQALTPEVIKKGIKDAKPLLNYEKLSEQGFARQHADWLIGMNGTRFVTNKAGNLFPVGRVQTSILSVVSSRCSEIASFKSEKYFEITGKFILPDSSLVSGIYVDSSGNTRLKDEKLVPQLKKCLGTKAEVIDCKTESKEMLPPQLYSLNDLQKDAFRYFGYSAELTLRLVQKLYEDYKCVSYPRTPSKVMGSQNVELCSDLYQKFLRASPEYFVLHPFYRIDGSDRRIFNDAKLEAHHAIIPLDKLPPNAAGDEENIYYLILERFMLAFAPAFRYEKTCLEVSVGGYRFRINGRKVTDEGFRKFRRFTRTLKADDEMHEEIQDFGSKDIKNLYLNCVESNHKFTKPPKHFNEASILAFMENPKGESGDEKLTGLGTPATRHTIIPKLLKAGYIEIRNKNILVTSKGNRLLSLLKTTGFSSIADIGETTRWENSLEKNPAGFEEDIRTFVKKAVSGDNTCFR